MPLVPVARPTLRQAFLAALLALALLLGLLLFSLVRASERSLIRSSEERRQALSARIVSRVSSYLLQAESALARLESRLRLMAATPGTGVTEAFLYAEMLDTPDLAELAFTHARRGGFAEDGAAQLLPDGRWQVSVYRESGAADSPLVTRVSEAGAAGFVARLRRRPPGAAFGEGVFERAPSTPPDPTAHLTFLTPASERFAGRRLWSDLSYSELDAALPEAQRRVVVTVLEAVEDRDGAFLGVLRAAILERAIDGFAVPEAGAPERTFLCDERGRLLTRFSPGDALHEQDGDLRIVSAGVPPEVSAALARPELRQVRADNLRTAGRFELGGRAFLFGFQGLPATQGWRLGVVVAEDALPGLAELRREQRTLLLWALGLVAASVLGGVLVLRSVGRDLQGVLVQTGRMGDFDFAPVAPRATFREVESVLAGLERAKTALRALGKYAPVDLVRQLFKANREPVLGGEPRTLSVMFTDIKDFTSCAESLAPDALADVLGRYLAAMTAAVHATGGSIDKYIGDAVMAIWNAPSECPDHALRACRAALDCVAATEALYASPDWGSRPRFVTRFGIHSGEMLVGHFGAPDRMSYTVLGDGVNLAARLEALNKQYGTTILVSEACWSAAKDAFAFRRLDRVAVKGKSQGVGVHELLGDARTAAGRVTSAHSYERALDHYFAGRFADALGVLEGLAAEDPPSATLLARCREYLASPPGPSWDGVYVSRTK